MAIQIETNDNNKKENQNVPPKLGKPNPSIGCGVLFLFIPLAVTVIKLLNHF